MNISRQHSGRIVASTFVGFAAFVVMLGAILLPGAVAAGQCTAQWIPGEDVSGIDGAVNTTQVLPGGDLVFAGAFLAAGNVPANNIVRYNPTTGAWSSLGGGTNDEVRALAMLPNGRLVAGGLFSTAGGVPASRLAQFDFETNTWSALGTGVSNSFGFPFSVSTLSKFANGDLFIAGNFNRAGTIETRSVIRFNFATNTYSAVGNLGANSLNSPDIVASIVLSSGDILVAARTFSFSLAGNSSLVARYNTMSGLWTAVPIPRFAGFGGVRAFLERSVDEVIIGGGFAPLSGGGFVLACSYNPTTNAAALLTGLALTISANTQPSSALVMLPSGEMLVGGFFTLQDPLNSRTSGARSIARYNFATNSWSPLGRPNFGSESNFLSGPRGIVNSITVLPNGRIVAAGNAISRVENGPVLFGRDVRNETDVAQVAMFNPDDGSWSALASGTNNPINAMASLPGGDVLVGGTFSTIGGIKSSALARYSPSTNTWNKVLGPIPDSFVYASASAADGSVFVGGRIEGVGNVARYNPVSGTAAPLGPLPGAIYPGSTVLALDTLASGELVAGGYIANQSGATGNNFFRYSPVANTWTGIGGGTNATINAVLALPNGDIIAGGEFTSTGGVAVNRIAKFNAASGLWTPFGTGVDQAIAGLTPLQDGTGDILVSGSFRLAGGVAVGGLARLNPVTGAWAAFGNGGVPNNSSINAVRILSDGDVVVSGTFASIGGTAAANIARYRASTNTWSPYGSGVNRAGLALLELANGDLLAGGSFTTAGGNVSAYFARFVAAPEAPVVSSQPRDAYGCAAAAVRFDVSTFGPAATGYAWSLNGVAIDVVVNPSAATASLVIASPRASDAGEYTVTITSPCGSVTSDAATLTVGACACSLADNAGGGPDGLLPDGMLDGADFTAFINSFAAGEARADVAGGAGGSGPDGVVDGSDFIAFINSFVVGC